MCSLLLVVHSGDSLVTWKGDIIWSQSNLNLNPVLPFSDCCFGLWVGLSFVIHTMEGATCVIVLAWVFAWYIALSYWSAHSRCSTNTNFISVFISNSVTKSGSHVILIFLLQLCVCVCWGGHSRRGEDLPAIRLPFQHLLFPWFMSVKLQFCSILP